MTTASQQQTTQSAPKIKTLAPAPVRDNPVDVAAYIVATYGPAKGAEYARLMQKVNSESHCTVAVDWWREVEAALSDEKASSGS